MKKFIFASVLALGLTTFVGCDETNGDDPELNRGVDISDNATDSTDDIASSVASQVSSYEVLATYGSNELTVADFLVRLRPGLDEEEWFFRQLMQFDDEQMLEHWNEPAADGSGLSNFETTRARLLEEVMDLSTLVAIATERGYVVTDEMFDEAWAEFLDEMSGIEAQGFVFEDLWYDFYGITVEEFKPVLRNGLAVDLLRDSLSDTITITDADVLAYFEENHESVASNLGFEARTIHILIPSERTDSEDERQVAEAEAIALLARVNAGEDMSELAAIYSSCPSGVNSGGLLEFTPGLMVPEFDNWSFNADYGDTDVIETQFGFHVVKSLGVEGIEDNLDEVRNFMRVDRVFELLEEAIEEANMTWTINEDVLSRITLG